MQLHYQYKRSHVATHHPLLGDEARDPDLVLFVKQGVYRPSSAAMLWLRLAVLPALGSKAATHVWFLVRDRLARGRRGSQSPANGSEYWRTRMRWDRIGLAALWIAVITVAAVSGHLLLVGLFWIVPYLTAFQVLGWYIELSEHTPMVRMHNIDIHMARNRKSRGLEKFLTGTYSDHRHLDHHLDPRTPYWNLGRVHDIRMADPDYAKVDAQFGGLFIRGEQGQPSAITALIRELAHASRDAANPDVA